MQNFLMQNMCQPPLLLKANATVPQQLYIFNAQCAACILPQPAFQSLLYSRLCGEVEQNSNVAVSEKGTRDEKKIMHRSQQQNNSLIKWYSVYVNGKYNTAHSQTVHLYGSTETHQVEADSHRYFISQIKTF